MTGGTHAPEMTYNTYIADMSLQTSHAHEHRALGTLLGTCSGTARTQLAEHTQMLRTALDLLRAAGGVAEPKPPTVQDHISTAAAAADASHGRKVWMCCADAASCVDGVACVWHC